MRAARWALASVILAATVWLRLLSAFAFGTYYLNGPGAARVQEQSLNLAISLTVGFLGLAVATRLLRGRAMSAWLFGAVVIPIVALLNHAGVTR